MSKADVEAARQIMTIVPKVMRLIRKDLRQAARNDLSVPMFRLLARLARASATNGELAEWLGVSPASACRLVDGLVALTYARRLKTSRDAREVIVELTAAGRKRYDEIFVGVQSSYIGRVGPLSNSRKRELAAGMTVLQELFGEIQ